MIAALLAITIAKAAPTQLVLKVDGVERKALVYASSVTNKPSPVVFVFHGFTGNAVHAAASYKVHEAWPEATVVYPQGLEVHLLGRDGPGWQIAGRMQGDRDLKFYDAMLGKMRTDYKADMNRVYTCGMSNGAIFSYLLVANRGKTLAAAAPVAGLAMPAFRGAQPMPMLITHGTADPLLKFETAVKSRDAAIENNHAKKSDRDWAPGYDLYTAPKGMDVVWHQHSGGHEWPDGTTKMIVKFFKEHQRG
ncbi:MAG: esterase [Armatimonadetes bacterium]|nr:esterase [Armatimonadota bacterium]